MNRASRAAHRASGGSPSGALTRDPVTPRQRVVILGASNVVRNVSTVIATAERFRGQPLDLLAAMGHGRSYGQTSRVLGRALPAITKCAIWEALAERPRLTAAALVTDVGNDLLYGASVTTIVSWVEQCLVALKRITDEVIITELPVENIARLNLATFFLIRSTLFPRSRLSLLEARDMSVELNEHMKQLALTFSATLIKPDAGWYGADPIHIHRRHRDAAWQQILRPWEISTVASAEPFGDTARLPLSRCRPHVRWLMGIEQRRAQPALHLPSGTQVSFF